MAFELLNLGTTANDGTGDNLNAAGIKLNQVIAFLNGDFALRFDTAVSDATAGANTLQFVDTSSNTVTITLPAVAGLSIPVGTTVEIVDVAGTFATNNCTIAVSDGEKIQRVVASLVLSTNDQVVKMIYSGTTYGWIQS